jgi:hypothetical protein
VNAVTSSGVQISAAIAMCRCRSAASAARRRLLPLRRRHQFEQAVRDALAGRQHDRQRPRRLASMMSATRRMQAASANARSPELEHTHEFAMTP